MRSLNLFLLMCTALWLGATAQVHAQDARTATLTPERAVKYRRPFDLRFSPDGSTVAFAVSEVNGLTIDTHLWLLRVAQQDVRQFTFSQKSERSPQWAPSGEELAFLSNRAGAMQVYVMSREGGEAQAITANAAGVVQYHWSPDGKQIAFLARESDSLQEANAPRVADRQQDLARLWVVDIASAKSRQVTTGAWRINDFEWLDSGQVLAIATSSPRIDTASSDALYRISLGDGAFTLYSKPNQPFRGLVMSPNRERFSFVSTRAGGPIPHDLYMQSVAAGDARDATAVIDRAVSAAKWQSDSVIWVQVADGFHSRIFRVNAADPATAIGLPYSVGAFDVARDGTLVYSAVGFNRLPEIYVRHTDGVITQAGKLQQGWDEIQLFDAEIFHFKSFDGADIEAALMQPAMMPRGGRLPLVVLVHGGPAGYFSADYFWFNSWPQLLAGKGYQVLMVNPRGSTGYGEKFVKANRADLGGGDYRDVMAGLDAVIARGQTDPNRLGIGGWSYGGEMTQWAIGHTNRFKAAVSGAGVFDQSAEFGSEDGAAEDRWYMGSPWENPDVFARNSPATYIRNAKTPTLIVHGEEDHNNPVGQSLALYRALKYFGVPSELVIYPGEPHLPRQEKHQIDVLQRMLAWFDRYLQ
jgi:dipeptidyl aminopeptidase/acylaminoacyl peptidase